MIGPCEVKQFDRSKDTATRGNEGRLSREAGRGKGWLDGKRQRDMGPNTDERLKVKALWHAWHWM